MIWKTTLAFLVSIKKNQNLKNSGLAIIFLLAAFFAPVQSALSQSSVNCNIDVVGCPPTDIVETCGNETVNSILGNYVGWTEPDYSLDCGDENGFQYEISFDLPESQEECWTFSRVQRVGTSNGVLNLWKSTGNTVNPIVTSPSFFIDELMEGTLDIYAPSTEGFQVRVYLLNAEGTQSGVLDTFQVNGNNTVETYSFSVDPTFYDGTGSYEGRVFRIRFEFVPTTPMSNGTRKYVELITLDAGLFGAACAAEANFAVVSTHKPGDFFPTGTTTVTYTATCNGCSPVISESCSFDVVVKPMPAVPVSAETIQPTCETATGSITIEGVTGMQYSINGGTFSSTTKFIDLNPGNYSITAKNNDSCESEPLLIVLNNQPQTPAAPVASVTLQPGCDSETGTISVSNIIANSTYTLVNNDGTSTPYIFANGSFSGLAGGTYKVKVSNGSCQSTSEALTIVAFQDTEAPVANVAELPSVKGECTATITAAPTATDNCSGTITATTTDALTYTAQGNHTVTWTYTDAKGNTSTQTQTVIVDDVTAPVANVATIPTVTGECSATVASAPTATDNCGGTITATTTDALNYTAQGTFTITWTYDDGNGNISTQEQTVIVDDVTAPVADVATLPTVTGECSATVASAPTATDNCGATITATTTDALNYTSQGTYTVTWTYDDGNGNTSTQTQTVIVDDVTAPVADVAELSTVTGECSATVASAPTATDNCGATITATTTDAFNYTSQGTYTVTWTYNDGNGNTSTQTQTVIVDDVTAPVADVAELPTVTGECSATVASAPTATDNCGATITATTEDALTYTAQGTYTVTWTYNDGNGNTSIQEQTVIVDDVTAPVANVSDLTTVTGECSATVTSAPTAKDNCGGTITATTEDALTYTAQGTYTITWNYNDGNGNTSTQTQTVIVDDVTAPVANITNLPAISGGCSVEVTGFPTATDNCGGTITATTEDELTYTEQGTYTITWTYNDGNGNTSSQTQTVVVSDTAAPVADLSNLPILRGECSVTVETIPTATDNCSGEKFEATTENPLSYTEQGTYIITWTYNDGNGNTSTQNQTIIVDDVTAPVADVAELPTVTGECSATVASAPTATDNCGATITATTEDALTYTAQGTYTINWTYNDGNGNTSTQEQIVIVDDVTAPVAKVSELPTVTGECSATVASAPTATDNCGGTITATTEDDLTYNEQGTYTITWTYNDGNGNTATQEQTVIVDDVTAPIADVAELSTVTGECSATVASAPTATDNCGATITATTEDALTYTEQGTYIVIWTYDDGNGNVSTQEQTVIVDDVTAPVADVTELPTVTGECSATVASAPTATDNCGATITATTEDALTYSEQGTFTITWTYNDGNGNISTQSQTVIVDDITAPVADIAELPTITGGCSVEITQVPTATDNCGATITATTEDALTYEEQGTYVIAWTYNDGNGNTSTQEQTVIVDDTAAPTPDMASLPTVTAECSVTVNVIPTATDNCSGEMFEATTNDPLNYSEQGTYTITWTYDDGNGNTSTQTQTVIVDDVTAPVADVAELPTVTGECSATVASAPTATDNCGGTITATNEDALTYNEQGTYTITWTYNDGNGNTSTQTQIVIVDDVTAPVADVAELSTVTGECSATVASAPTATDNCGSTITATTTDALTYPEQGTYTITWTYNDGNGNVSTQEQTVIVDDVTAPLADVAELPTVTGECSATVASAPTATDNCGGTITATTEDALTYTAQGTYTITWTYNDGNGNTSTQEQTVIVDDVTAPVADVATLPTVTGECSATVASAPTATDNCGGTITATTTDALTYTAQGTYTITWTYNDGNGNTSTQTQTVIVDDVTAPVANVAELPTVTGECSATVASAPTATDNCGGTITATNEDALTYNEQGTYTITWTYNDGNGNTSTQTQIVIVDDVTAPVADVAELPTVTGECSATVASAPTATDNCGGTITATTEDALTYTAQGTYTITWTYDDGNGNTSTQTQTVIVDDVTAPAANLTELPNVTGECSATVASAPTATDNCGGTITATTEDALTYTAQGTYIVTWTYDDGNGNTSSQTQTVIVDDVTAPVADVAELPNVTGECSATVASAPTATDNCGGTITGTTEDALTYTEQGTYTITWTYDDGNGNTSSQTQTVIVDDVTAPVANLTELPTVTGECSATVAVAPTATDNCGGTITATTTDALTYTAQGTYTITWTYNDANGNTSTQEQTVIVDDVTAPVADVTELPAVTGECSATVASAPTATDNCGGTITATTEDALTYTAQGTYTITWTYNDGNGNTSIQEQTVIVDDVTAPVANVATLPTVTGECSATVASAPTATDNCGGTITATTEDALTYTAQGTYTITWTYNDGNGNTSTQTQTVIVDDVTAPVADVATLPAVTGECSATVASAPTATDNCGGTITATTEDALTYDEPGTYTITWIFNDGNGNTTTQTQTVTVTSISAPQIASTTQPTCDLATGSFTVVTVAGLEYSIDGENYSANGTFENLAPGVYFVAAMNAAGCMSPLTEVEINEANGLTAPQVAGTVQPTCTTSTGSFTVVTVDGVSYSINGTDFQTEAEFANLNPGTYNLTARNEAGCVSQAVAVTINESQSTAVITTTTVDLCTEDSIYDLFELLTGEYDETGTWTDPDQTGALTGSSIDPSLLPVGQYTFTYVLGGDCPSTTSVEVSINSRCVVLVCDFEDIKNGISKAVTPNGDTFNDTFIVDKDRICDFSYNLKIFNRWGAEVFAINNYMNNWDGQSNKSVSSSNQLPSGTYFYIIEINGSGFEPIQGYIYLGTK